jgi:hypothetical protein
MSRTHWLVPEPKTTRLVARMANGKGWFPSGISEVVSHTDEHWIAVNVARLVQGRPAVLMREFECHDRSKCRAELRLWLLRLGAESESDLSAVRDWSERVADHIVQGLVAG